MLAFYKYEAQPVKLNLFGSGADLTLLGRLTRDPNVNAIVKLGEGIHRQWDDEDVENAKKQRAEAEKVLLKFNAA